MANSVFLLLFLLTEAKQGRLCYSWQCMNLTVLPPRPRLCFPMDGPTPNQLQVCSSFLRVVLRIPHESTLVIGTRCVCMERHPRLALRWVRRAPERAVRLLGWLVALSCCLQSHQLSVTAGRRCLCCLVCSGQQSLLISSLLLPCPLKDADYCP